MFDVIYVYLCGFQSSSSLRAVKTNQKLNTMLPVNQIIIQSRNYFTSLPVKIKYVMKWK